MDRGPWWATIHGLPKESDMTSQRNNNNVDKDCRSFTAHREFHRAEDAVSCSKQKEHASLVLRCPQVLMILRILGQILEFLLTSHRLTCVPASVSLCFHGPPNCSGNSGCKSSCFSDTGQIHSAASLSVCREVGELGLHLSGAVAVVQPLSHI